MRYLVLKDRRVIDLEEKDISSWEYIDEETAKSEEWGLDEAFYNVYYFFEDKGEYSEQDGKGGRSMDTFYASQILATCDTIQQVIEYQGVTITSKEYERLKKDSEQLIKLREILKDREELIDKLFRPYAIAHIPEDIMNQIVEGKFIDNEIRIYDCYENPDAIQIINRMIVKRSER